MAATQAISFNDLPPEIRNIIYGLALQADKPINLTHHYSEVKTNRAWPFEYQKRWEPVMQLGERPYLNVSLLLVSRPVNAEAGPVLYGANTFAFGWAGILGNDLLLFLNRIGNYKKHLRSIKVGFFDNAANMRSALHQLKQATQLDSFACSGGMVQDLLSTPSHFKALLPLLKVLQKAARGSNERKGPLEVFNVYDLQWAPLWCSQAQAENHRRMAGEDYAELRTRLSKALA